jgi:glycosyltransferase involved in cell wall biosynthesis
MVVGSHHLAREFARRGHRVLHLSSPVTAWHTPFALMDRATRQRLRRCAGGCRQLEERLFEWVPFAFAPWFLARRFDFSVTNRLLPSRRSIVSTLRQLCWSGVDLLLVDEPRLVGIEKILRPSITAYRATDLYAQMKGDPSIDDAERTMCQRSAHLFATSKPVAEHLERNSGRHVTTIENGVDLEHFQQQRAPHISLKHTATPRVVFVGAVDFRFDVKLIRELAMASPHVTFLVYGPVSVPVGPKVDNLLFQGRLAYDDLPSVLQHCDLGLLPTNDHPANNARSPMKLYEYAAAGLPVLARRTDELARREAGVVTTFATLAQAKHLLASMLRDHAPPDIRAIAQHGWGRKADQILSIVTGNSKPAFTKGAPSPRAASL